MIGRAAIRNPWIQPSPIPGRSAARNNRNCEVRDLLSTPTSNTMDGWDLRSLSIKPRSKIWLRAVSRFVARPSCRLPVDWSQDKNRRHSQKSCVAKPDYLNKLNIAQNILYFLLQGCITCLVRLLVYASCPEPRLLFTFSSQPGSWLLMRSLCCLFSKLIALHQSFQLLLPRTAHHPISVTRSVGQPQNSKGIANLHWGVWSRSCIL